MQPKADAQLLRDYAERGADAAFTELVHRHANLVYSAALRQVESPDTAAEITQGVFIGLARGAPALAPRLAAEASLAGWLCRSARNLSLNHRRDEFRRLTRERHAMEQLISIPDDAPNWEHLRRVLDDAMAELTEADYDALVLRFFQNQDFRTVGAAIGVSDDTAQKRVARALEKLRELLSQRGIRTSAAALSVVISANAVQAAPVGLAVTISTAAALAGTAATASTLIAATTKTIAMTTLQKTLVTATVAVLAGAGIYEARQTAQLRDQNQTLQQQQAPLAGQIQQLQGERDEATNRLALLLAENSRLKSNPNQNELLKLRGEVAPLRREVAQLARANESQSESNSRLSSLLAEVADTIATNDIGRTNVLFTKNLQDVGTQTLDNALQTTLWAFLSTEPGALRQILDPASPMLMNGMSILQMQREALQQTSEVYVQQERDNLDGSVDLNCRLKSDNDKADDGFKLLLLHMKPSDQGWRLYSSSAPSVKLSLFTNGSPVNPNQ